MAQNAQIAQTKSKRKTHKDIRVRDFPIEQHRALKHLASLADMSLEAYVSQELLKIVARRSGV